MDVSALDNTPDIVFPFALTELRIFIPPGAAIDTELFALRIATYAELLALPIPITPPGFDEHKG